MLPLSRVQCRISSRESNALSMVHLFLGTSRIYFIDLLQVRRPNKALIPDICKVCWNGFEICSYLFFISLSLGTHDVGCLVFDGMGNWVWPPTLQDFQFVMEGFNKKNENIFLWGCALFSILWSLQTKN